MAAKKKTETIPPKKAGQKPIKFQKGGLHESTNTPKDQPIPASKKAAALRGDYGPKAKKQAQLAKHVLTGGRRKK